MNLKEAQKIFGYFDKSQLIDLFRLILSGDKKQVFEIYRKIYDQGVEPKVFINDFLELIYYFKNINSLTLEGANFSLNDEEFSKIKEISDKLDSQVLILFWQFTIRTLEELDIVSNQHLSIEMFLMRLMYLNSFKLKENLEKKNDLLNSPITEKEEKVINTKTEKEEKVINTKNDYDLISQIKNTTQEEKIKPETQIEIKTEEKIEISSFDQLIHVSTIKKEMKLKYELEKNVNLVSFERNRIEISFNDNLDKNFVKDLSLKLFEWTDQRWVIILSKTKGEISIKEKESELYKIINNKFPDASLVNVKPKKEIDE